MQQKILSLAISPINNPHSLFHSCEQTGYTKYVLTF